MFVRLLVVLEGCATQALTCLAARECTCSLARRARYLRAIPRRLLARTDLFVQRLSSLAPNSSVSSFDTTRAAAVEANIGRHAGGAPAQHNGAITDTQAVIGVPSEVTDRLDDAVRRGVVTAATASRSLLLAWTMADLDARARPEVDDLDEILAQ